MRASKSNQLKSITVIVFVNDRRERALAAAVTYETKTPTGTRTDGRKECKTIYFIAHYLRRNALRRHTYHTHLNRPEFLVCAHRLFWAIFYGGDGKSGARNNPFPAKVVATIVPSSSSPLIQIPSQIMKKFIVLSSSKIHFFFFLLTTLVQARYFTRPASG